MPRPTKRSTIAKRLYAQRCASTEAAPLPLKITEAEFPPLPLKKRAEAARPPLKTYKAEVTPLPRKKMADCSGSCNPGPTQQVPPCPAKTNGKEAATLPLKISQAKVMPTPCKKKGRFCHRVETTPQQVPPLPVGTIWVEAKTLPLKTSRAEVIPHPRIKKGRFCHRVETTPQQVPPLPVGAIGVEANTLPLKTSRAEVMPHPRKKIGGFCHRVETTPQQVPPLPVNPIGVEAAPLPLKRKRAPTNERTRSLDNYTISFTSHEISFTSHEISYTSNKLSENNPNFHRSDQSHSSRESEERFAIPSKLNANALNTLNVCADSPQKAVLKGSFNQADARFGDSSFPSTSGKALYSEVLKRSPKVCESVNTEVRPSDFQVDSGKPRQPQMKHPMKTQLKSMKKPIQTEQNIPAICHESACCDFPQKSMLRGSFDQADARFGDSRNRQCGAIGLTAVLKSKLKNVLTWTTQDLDAVLVEGTRLYESLRKHGNIKDREVKGRNYIAVHELPRRHMLGNTTFSIEYTPSLTGFVNVNEYHEYDHAISTVAMPLDVALQQTLLSADAFLLTICANTSAVIKQGSWYAVVDSHAIRTDTSCVVYHSTIESLYNYINDMAQLFGEPEPPFEITGVLVHADAEVSDPLQEAGSSSFPCSSGKALYSDVLKRTPKIVGTCDMWK
ncbi:uncharacterized protein LOC127952021 [Carassius gibelio]|uniref:uncharacterized protein LOC127952021 n=1 Tax=Carassius gibelio TaxID=101364 RepID=UPI002278D5BC|nr:uncharacterized protein LOC127952021 [Carassius gibelio]